jgi:predicted small secreted protein
VSERRSGAMLLRRHQEGVRTCRIPSLAVLVLASSLVLVGCGTDSGLGSTSKVAPSTTQPAPSTTASPASAFDPQGASTPSEGALAFENAIDNREAVALCDLISPAYLAAVVKLVTARSSESCVEIWTREWETGATAQVVIDYNIPPNSGATLANDNVALTLQNGRWLVSTAGD